MRLTNNYNDHEIDINKFEWILSINFFFVMICDEMILFQKYIWSVIGRLEISMFD